jgi:tetratricopeptide (TPR) repeat protein
MEQSSKDNKAAELKEEGNALFVKKQYDRAAEKYTAAIGEDNENAILFTNRAACYLAMRRLVFIY